MQKKRETSPLASVPENLLYKSAGNKTVAVLKKNGLFTKALFLNSCEPGNLP